MKYIVHIDEPWFSLIKLGIKNVEARINIGDFSKICIGDSIEWYNNDLSIERRYITIVKNVKFYRTFAEYLKREQLAKTLPSIETIADGIKIYHKHLTEADITKEEIYGVIAIYLKTQWIKRNQRSSST
jgi:ASC-1-like (ASCH) protein